ncbi:MAG TPA: uracil phosphoribosyltransferase [Rhodothermales bacterium]|nr:uracil phosphoribosyltransferase [Rhodothermales bacterium]
MQNLTVVDHPILKRDLTILRRRETPHGTFRRTLESAAAMLAYEALRALPLREVQFDTPLEPAVGYELAGDVILVPILRAGLGMVDGFLRFLPDARVGHLGMYRDEHTRRPVDYYSSIPSTIASAHVFVTDPMLATGGSAVNAVSFLKARGASRIYFVCLVAAPEGVDLLSRHHPDVPILTAALDRGLDSRAFIRPGLGDAGDRIFGTNS